MTTPKPTAQTFTSDQEVRWCPGCGDYAILKAVRETLAARNAQPHNTVMVSGIGCAARFPYYMNTYGLHTIHGRAPAVATGLKSVRPDMDVWVVTGDGDGMSIGAGHLFHLLRRNVDLQILLFNNRTYGLTKGQSSPTSVRGFRSPSTPGGVVEKPAEPCNFALGCGAHFVARALDVQQPELRAALSAAHEFAGTGFIEILQNCPIYNDGTFAVLSDKETTADNCLHVAHGKPLLFGSEGNRGLRLPPGTLAPEVVTVDPERPHATEGLLVHDETNLLLATMLAGLTGPEYPVALGILFRKPGSIFKPATSTPEAKTASRPLERRLADIDRLLNDGNVWQVE